MDEQITGASDWRSDAEKQKSLLRKAAASLFKTWIPDHPEASQARGELWREWRDAMLNGTMPGITMESMLSQGAEDILGHDYHDVPLSMQELLVQREGSDAFLDPKNALRVVRRKFSMMTLVGRMASTMEQRNIAAVSVRGDIEQEELINFGRLLAARVDGTAIEEEAEFKKKMRQGRFQKVEVLYHSEMVGRRLPVPWAVKHLYTLIARAAKKGEPIDTATQRLGAERVPRLSPKALRQLLLYAPDLNEELDQGWDPIELLLQLAEERPLLNATRNVFDEFSELRKERRHARALGDQSSAPPEAFGPGESAEELARRAAEVEEALADDFVAEAEDLADDEFVRLAKGLELVRQARGPEFFSRITMVSGDVSFVATAMGSGFSNVEQTVAALDPKEGLLKARAVTEPFYRARALATVVPQLKAIGLEEEAEKAAEEALEAARRCQTTDVDQAYTAALTALLEVGHIAHAGDAVREALGNAHHHDDLEERSASLMRVVSTLMEAGPLPPEVRKRLSQPILGEDVHFWGKKEITPQLVEVILSLLTGDDDDTVILLQKVVVHPNDQVRRSVIRAMPFDNEELQGILLSHLRDSDPEVRVEVAERIGYSGDRKLSLYLQNHVRHDEAQTLHEKRAVAMNLARLDPVRFTPLFNAMLGKLATEGPGLTDRFKPLKNEEDWQLAALEVLYHLNSQQAHRLVFNAQKRVKGALAEPIKRAWRIVKSHPYGDPTLPRSRHDPEWSETDDLGFLALVERDFKEVVGEEPEPELPPEEAPKPSKFEREKSGLFGKLKSIFSRAPEEAAPPGEDAEGEAVEGAVEEASGAPTSEVAPERSTPHAAVQPGAPTEPRRYVGPARAALRFEAMLLEGEGAYEGELPMTFTLYAEADGSWPVWRERRESVPVKNGTFEVVLGVDDGRLPDVLPGEVWLGISVDGEPELMPRPRLSRARSVVQG